MNDIHIRQDEWIVFFSHSTDHAQKDAMAARVVSHMAICPACRAIFEKGRNLQTSLRSHASHADAAGWPDAYQEVASPISANENKPVSGFLAVDIEVYQGNASFMEETLEAVGCAKKYALNVEDNGKRMDDDGGALTIMVENGKLRVRFSDGAIQANAKLITEKQVVPMPFADGIAEVSLPEEDFCTLDMSFAK